MPARKSILYCLLVSFIASCGSLANAQFDVPPKLPPPTYIGKSLPTFSGANWVAPTPLTPFTDATATLAKQGIPSPVGGDYRTITIVSGNCWDGGGALVEVHGWVMPSSDSDKQRFAVCWNGLVYPVIKLGDIASLKSDVDALIAKSAPKYPAMEGGAAAEYAADEKSLTAMKACMLYMDGQYDLAAKYVAHIPAPHNYTQRSSKADNEDPYLALASDWAWYLYDRSVNSHMRGDDTLSLLSAQTLTAVLPLIEAECSRRGYTKPDDWLNNHKVHPYLYFCEAAPELANDEAERVTETSHPPAYKTTYPTKEARIKALIGDLNQVAVRQMGQPGGVDLGEDPTVQALVAEGDDAVPELLDAFQNDNRLTRSVHFWRNFSRSRSPLAVYEAAYVALSGILQSNFFGAGSTGDDLSQHPDERMKLAEAMRTQWLKYKGLSPVERWYKILANDNESPRHWLESASHITQPDNITYMPGSMVFTTSVRTPLKDGQRPKMLGEPLRDNRTPSVTSLFAKRVNQLESASSFGTESFSTDDTCEMVMMMSKWDSKASLPSLTSVMTRIAHLDNYSLTLFHEQVVKQVAKLTDARIDAHDPAAQKEFANWSTKLAPDMVSESFDGATGLEPLWKYPDDPTAQATSERLFNGKKSKFYSLATKGCRSFDPANFLTSQVLSLPAFQRHVLRELADNTECASLAAPTPDTPRVQFSGGSFIGIEQYGNTGGSDQIQKPSRGVSAAELYANGLSRMSGMPVYHFLLDGKHRQEIIDLDRDLLTRYGHQIKLVRDQVFEDEPPTAKFVLPILNHPATASDVAAGRAIFSLSGTVRIAPLKLPVQAVYLPPGVLTTKDNDQKVYGTVWQAEEVFENGNWVRYYGFIGGHIFGKIPATQVTLQEQDR